MTNFLDHMDTDGRTRRRLLIAGAALPLAALARAQDRRPDSPCGSTRLAVVPGQSDHPAGKNLPPVAGLSGAAAISLAAEQADWTTLQNVRWPPDVATMCEQFLQKYPTGRYTQNAQILLVGAHEAANALQRRDVRLYHSAFEPGADWSDERRSELSKAARGDKDAAARIAHWYSGADSGVQRGRYEGWLQYATGLGNGMASYELALYYRKNNQAQQAAQFEARARELGYMPPPSLTQARK